jgi:hypothetical protein
MSTTRRRALSPAQQAALAWLRARGYSRPAELTRAGHTRLTMAGLVQRGLVAVAYRYPNGKPAPERTFPVWTPVDGGGS